MKKQKIIQKVTQKRKYKCLYCNGHEFEAVAVKLPTINKHDGGSNTISCPQCGNFLPTWSGEFIENIKDGGLR